MGAFSEFIRSHDGSVRSKHPIWSLTCVGPESNEIFKNISNHAYDENSGCDFIKMIIIFYLWENTKIYAIYSSSF